MKIIAAFLLLSSVAVWGQTATGPFIPLYVESCDQTLVYAGQTKPIREIFPAMCPAVSWVIVQQSATTSTPIVTLQKKPALKPDPLSRCHIERPAEDVPAIRSEFYWCGGPDENDLNNGVPRRGPLPKHPVDHQRGCRVPPPVPEDYTCTDKTRILLTAEDGKKYCHAPHTKPETFVCDGKGR